MKNLFILAAFILSFVVNFRAQSEGVVTARGQEAIEQLRQSGDYKSLGEAVRRARKKGGQADELPTKNDWAGKRKASPAAAGDQFGISVAISGDTAIVGTSNDSVGNNIAQGSAYVFTRIGTTWRQQALLVAANGVASDQFGVSVGISGDTVIVGSVFDNFNVITRRGTAYIFVRSGNSWTQQAKLLPGTGGINDRFGSSVAISGETAVVGANQDNSAYVYVRNGTSWTQQARLLAIPRQTGTSLGTSVAISGDTIVAGNTSDTVGSNSQQGSAYVFVRSGTTWSQQARLVASDGAGGDVFGISIAISGDTAVVGTIFHDVGGMPDQGAAYVFLRNGTLWSQQAQLVAANGAADDRFGQSVAISGDTAVVGVNLSDTGARNQGSAYVFVRSGTAWTQQTQLLASDGSAGDQFGIGVAISGDTVVVGASFDDVGPNIDQGSAYIFVRGGTVWTQQTQVTTSAGDDVSDDFGVSVAISGDTAIVGADGDDVGSGFDQGSAYIFVRNGATWSQQARLVASDGIAQDFFGSAVAISGDTAVVGAAGDDVGANVGQGSTYIFVRSGTTWTQQAQIFAADGAAFDEFGVSVAIEGDTVVAAADQDDIGTNISQGSAYVFVRNGTAWTQQTKLVAAGGGSSDKFGVEVALSGGTAIVGAFQHNVGANTFQGSAYVFVRSGTLWAQQAELVAADGRDRDKFGIAVAISGDTALVGAFQHNVGTSVDQGSAYVFVRSGAAWTQQAELTVADGAAFDGLGISTALSVNTAVVGAYQVDNGANISQGAAYIFVRNGTTWSQQTKLFDNAGSGGDNFGFSAAISNANIIIGAPSALTASPGSSSLGRPASVDQGAANTFTVPAASQPVTVSGRVLTSDGRGLRNATVSITDASGIRRITTTSSFGFYQFDNVLSYQTYTFNVFSRLFRFAPRVLQVTDTLTTLDFTGQE